MSEWIPLSDRLPDKSDQYLVTNGNQIKVMQFCYPDMFTAFTQPSFCVWDNSGDGWYVKSTFPSHWMPLPELPNSKKRLEGNFQEDLPTFDVPSGKQMSMDIKEKY